MYEMSAPPDRALRVLGTTIKCARALAASAHYVGAAEGDFQCTRDATRRCMGMAEQMWGPALVAWLRSRVDDIIKQ